MQAAFSYSNPRQVLKYRWSTTIMNRPTFCWSLCRSSKAKFICSLHYCSTKITSVNRHSKKSFLCQYIASTKLRNSWLSFFMVLFEYFMSTFIRDYFSPTKTKKARHRKYGFPTRYGGNISVKGGKISVKGGKISVKGSSVTLNYRAPGHKYK